MLATVSLELMNGFVLYGEWAVEAWISGLGLNRSRDDLRWSSDYRHGYGSARLRLSLGVVRALEVDIHRNWGGAIRQRIALRCEHLGLSVDLRRHTHNTDHGGGRSETTRTRTDDQDGCVRLVRRRARGPKWCAVFKSRMGSRAGFGFVAAAEQVFASRIRH